MRQMAAGPTVFLEDCQVKPWRRETSKYDYVSVQTHYDPGQSQRNELEETKDDGRARAEASYNYKPTALRTWFLLFVTAFLLGCVAVAEYALRNEPSALQVYKNETSGLSNRDLPMVPAKVWLGAALGNNLGPDGMPRAKGLPRMERGDIRVGPDHLVERVPGSTAFMPTGLTTRTAISSRVLAISRTKEISTSRTLTTEKTVLVTITPPAETSKDLAPTSTGKTGRGCLNQKLKNIC